MKLTEKSVQNLLHQWLFRKGYDMVIPNFTPPRFWEADLYAISKGGLAVEYEIKLTRADFKRDALKKQEGYSYGRKPTHGSVKYEQLAAHHPDGPSRFFYVAPKDMITREELPPWAGLVEVSEYRGRPDLSTRVKAPQLHWNKPDKVVHEKLQKLFFYRFWSLRHAVKGLPEGLELQDPLEIVLAATRARREELNESSTGSAETAARLAELHEIEGLLERELKDYLDPSKHEAEYKLLPEQGALGLQISEE